MAQSRDNPGQEPSHPKCDERFAGDAHEMLRALLAASGDAHQTLIHTIPAPVFLKDVEGVYRGCNGRFAHQILGLEPDQVVGKTIKDLTPRIPPELALKYHKMDAELLASGGVQVYEAKVKCADEDIRDFRFHKAVFHDAGGSVAGMIGIMLDISDHKNVERALRWELSRIRAQGEILRHLVNPGVSAEAVLKLLLKYACQVSTSEHGCVCSFVHGDTDRVLAVTEAWEPVLRTHQLLSPAAIRNAFPREPGYVPHPSKVRPSIFDDIPFLSLMWVPAQLGDEVLGYILVAQPQVAFGDETQVAVEDLAELLALVLDRERQAELHSQLETRLKRTEKLRALGQMVGGMAHEFNNQLGGVLTFSELLRDQLQYLGQDRLINYANQIMKGTRRAAELTRQLILFSREGKYRKVPTDVHPLIQSLLEEAVKAEEPLCKVVTRLKAQPSVISVDRSRMENAVRILIRNALDAMPQGGELTVETDVIELSGLLASALELEAGRFLRMQIGDTGLGMDPTTLEHLFEPFFTTKEVGKASGLGLATVYGLVRGYGGTIEVESEVGKGSRFVVYLPLHDAFGFGGMSRAHAQKGKPRILLLDDEEIIRESLADMLSMQGYIVESFGDGEAALAYYREHAKRVDLVILDAVMPGLSGRKVFEGLKAINADVRCLVVSGYALDTEARAMLELGVLAFVQKPVERDLLGRYVAHALTMESCQRGDRNDIG